MKKTITVGERDIVIRQIKARDLKSIMAQCKDRLDSIFAILDSKNIAKDALTFVIDNFEWLIGAIVQLSDLTLEEAEDLDMQEMVEVIMALIKIQGIDLVKVTGFFTQVLGTLSAPVEQTEAAGTTMFEEDIPILPEAVPELSA